MIRWGAPWVLGFDEKLGPEQDLLEPRRSEWLRRLGTFPHR